MRLSKLLGRDPRAVEKVGGAVAAPAAASDVPPYVPGWYSATMVPVSERPPLTYDLDVDVCVIGGGLAGLTTARELARSGWSVAVLERCRVGWHASGRNNGFVLPGFAESMERIVARVGIDHARALWDLAEMGLKYVSGAIADERMPGVAPIAGWLKASKTNDGDAAVAALRLYGEELGTEIEGWPRERVRAVLKTDRYFHGLYVPRAFHIHPLNYALGLAASAERHGARIFEGTPAQAIDVDGVRKRITTPSARVRASHIVLACNVHLGALMPRVAGTLVPIWSYVITTAPLGPEITTAVNFRGGVTDTDLANSQYRVVDGDRLMWSGHTTTWDADPRRYVARLQAEIAAIYPQLRQVPVEHVWSGVLGHALHRMPQIGELSPGLWLASAFGGHGINTTAMAGNVIARAIIEGDDTWRLFAPFELVWAGGRPGRAAMQVYYWWFDARERLQARQARRREGELRRAAELAALRAGEERAQVESDIGAMVPHEELPVEPTAAELPADPLIDGAEEEARREHVRQGDVHEEHAHENHVRDGRVGSTRSNLRPARDLLHADGDHRSGQGGRLR